MANLYELTGDQKRIEDQIIDAGGEITEETVDILNASNLAVKDKVSKVLAVLRNFKSNVNAIDLEIKRLSALKKTNQNGYEGLMEWSEVCMKHHKIDKVDTPTGGMAICKNPPSVEVVDKTLVPEDYIKEKTERNVDKAGALMDLKNGKEIPGLRLTTDKTHLEVR
jgi:hypothetical protein